MAYVMRYPKNLNCHRFKRRTISRLNLFIYDLFCMICDTFVDAWSHHFGVVETGQSVFTYKNSRTDALFFRCKGASDTDAG